MIAAINVHRLAGARWVLLLVAAFSSAAWAQAGYVHESSGKVFVQRLAAKAVAEKAGDTFDSNTVFRTGADGKVILKFADGQIVTLGADSALGVGRYRYIAGNLAQSTSALELLKGEMRYVAGLIGTVNPGAVHIVAGDSKVSIQQPGGADLNLGVSSSSGAAGYVVVALGGIAMDTPSGPTGLIASGQYLPWRAGRTPRPPAPVAAAPAAVQAAAADLWTTLLPADTPVETASAARMAAAAALYVRPATAAAGTDQALAGYVDSSSKSVFICSASGALVAVKAGGTFQSGTTLRTGAKGRAVLKFADGQLVALGPCSTLAVEQYQFDPNDVKASRSALDLERGEMRYVTGAIQEDNHAGISLTAGASMVDILGANLADVALTAATGNSDTGDHCGCGGAGLPAATGNSNAGTAAVIAGEIAVHTPFGIIRIGAGEVAPWDPVRGAVAAQPLAIVPPELRAAVTPLTALALPENTLVAVASSAREAAAVAAANLAQAAATADPGNPQLRAAAQAAAETANAATQQANAAAQSVVATLFATVLANLPSTAAGPAKAEVLQAFTVAQAQRPGATLPAFAAVTPGGGGGCTGSSC